MSVKRKEKIGVLLDKRQHSTKEFFFKKKLHVISFQIRNQNTSKFTSFNTSNIHTQHSIVQVNVQLQEHLRNVGGE